MTSITTTELSRHKTTQDLWVSVHGNVYDLTPFAADHPGGIDILVECAGTDASEAFDYAGHGDDATKTMQKFCVGGLEGYQGKSTVKSNDSKNGAVNIGATKLAAGTESITAASSGLRSQVITMATLLGAALLVGVFIRNLLLVQQVVGDDDEGKVSSSDVFGRLLGSVDSFAAGTMAASTFGSVGLGWAYRKFKETLKHEKEVFAYPPVIPRRKR
ncbi:cytochrome b5-like heme/steroid binding domain-containing protein [Cladorrhinum sp. PSN259]|nr:cytochrome b5-like heme/steroid binding domain-containing protein [Cladorrhinum sp. PSN259]